MGGLRWFGVFCGSLWWFAVIRWTLFVMYTLKDFKNAKKEKYFVCIQNILCFLNR